MLKIVSLEPRDLMLMPNDSNDVNEGKWTTSGHSKSLTRKPRPPPIFALAECGLWQGLGWPRNWKPSGVISNSWAGVVLGFWKVSLKAKMSMFSVAKMSEMKTERSGANYDRTLRVQRFSGMVGPGLVSISPERKMSMANVQVDWCRHKRPCRERKKKAGNEFSWEYWVWHGTNEIGPGWQI